MLSAIETSIAEWLANREGAMLALLEKIVGIDSNSSDKPGVDAVGDALADAAARFGAQLQRTPHDKRGDAFVLRLPGRGSHSLKPILLLGHRDTALPRGEARRRPFHIEAGRAHGPGVSDMKAGLVMAVFVLEALAAHDYPGPLVALFTADEEVGSHSSKALIEGHARAALAAFNCEPGREPNRIVHGRKGGIVMSIRVTGKAAHSGANIREGVSAIEELARKVLALHDLMEMRPGVTLNVGLISGGEAANTVAPEASASLDIRYERAQDREAVLDSVRTVVETCRSPLARGECAIISEFLPLARSDASRRLFSHYERAARDLGIAVESTFTGACSDSGFAAAAGCPVLCGVGPVGANWHTAQEYTRVASVVPRAQSLALTIHRLGPAGLIS